MKKSLNQVYGSPLPLKVRPLPPIIPHNPLSWFYWFYEYWFPREEPKISCIGTLIESLSSCSSEEDSFYVKVDNVKDIDVLWSMGFFGKGTLSRSEPSWYIRSARRLGLEGGDKLTSEDITAQRREERKKFKLERAKIEAEELERRKKLDEKNDPNNSEDVKIDIEIQIEEKIQLESVSQLQNQQQTQPQPSLSPTISSASPQSLLSTETPPSSQTSTTSLPIRPEDNAIIDSNNRLIQQEYLQLMPQEAFFLSYALGVLKVMDLTTNTPLSPEQLLFKFIERNPNFISDYVVYHHYRSLGWCVRSGIKFGSELMLYKRGPPFSHAEFAVRILLTGSSEQHDWWWNTSIGRIIGGVKKTLVFCYVDGDNQSNNQKIFNNTNKSTINIESILKSYKIREVVYRRWIATRNRD